MAIVGDPAGCMCGGPPTSSAHSLNEPATTAVSELLAHVIITSTTDMTSAMQDRIELERRGRKPPEVRVIFHDTFAHISRRFHVVFRRYLNVLATQFLSSHSSNRANATMLSFCTPGFPGSDSFLGVYRLVHDTLQPVALNYRSHLY